SRQHQRQTENQRERGCDQAPLEIHHPVKTRVGRVLRHESFVDRERLREDRKQNRLIPTDHREAPYKKRRRIECAPAYRDAGKRESVSDKAGENEAIARNQEKPARTVHEEKSERPPSIPKRSEVARMGFAPIGMERDWHLGHLRSKQAGLDDHLRRELHTR